MQLESKSGKQWDFVGYNVVFAVYYFIYSFIFARVSSGNIEPCSEVIQTCDSTRNCSETVLC